MVVIRLARGGRVKQAIYRIVAADKRRSASSKFLDILGTYNPHTKELKIDNDLVEKYLANGAQPSDRVLRLLQSQGVKTPEWAKPHDRFKKPKKAAEEAEKAEVPKEAAAEVTTEATDQTEDKAQSVDAPETAATEAQVAEDQKEATKEVAEAAAEAEKEAK